MDNNQRRIDFEELMKELNPENDDGVNAEAWKGFKANYGALTIEQMKAPLIENIEEYKKHRDFFNKIKSFIEEIPFKKFGYREFGVNEGDKLISDGEDFLLKRKSMKNKIGKDIESLEKYLDGLKEIYNKM